MSRRLMTCCCCGGAAGRFAQHWSRDTGYSICPRCVAEQCATSAPDEIRLRYGQPGMNYDQPIVRKDGRRYKVLATTQSQDVANAFMERTPFASVLLVFEDGTIVLADSRDEGQALEQPEEALA